MCIPQTRLILYVQMLYTQYTLNLCISHCNKIHSTLEEKAKLLNVQAGNFWIMKSQISITFFFFFLMKNIFESFGHYNFTTVEVESIYLAVICRSFKASEDG